MILEGRIELIACFAILPTLSNHEIFGLGSFV